ncbi:MAG: OsmC family protein [Rhodobacteraceae bacterium]|nr:OsmC family protein [Paracoccaceae bacterium]
MSLHAVDVIWSKGEADFAGNRYSRAHVWRFDGGIEVPASASPGVVPAPLSRPDAVDPEEAFIAAISSCHMLWFLDFARQAGLSVGHYHDRAEGRLTMSGGKVWIPRVTLNIRVTWAGTPPDVAAHDALHHKAHAACFIANSVRTEIVHNLL